MLNSTAVLSGQRWADRLWNRTNIAQRTNFTHKFSVVYGEPDGLVCQILQCWKWRNLGSHQNLPNFSPHKQQPRACPTIDCWLLAPFLPFSEGGYGLPLIFRVVLNWPISRFLSDLVPELFFPKEASGSLVLFCGQIFLDNGYSTFIINIPYYCLLLELFLRILVNVG